MKVKLILERATLEMRMKGERYRKVVEVEISDTDNSEAEEKGVWQIVGYVEGAKKMTKEELEKEAEEYAIGVFPNDEFKQSAVIQGIIKFTEPREKRINYLEMTVGTLRTFSNEQTTCIEELKKENAELRNNGFTVSAMTEQQLRVAIEKGEQLERENAELKSQIEKMKCCNNCKFDNLEPPEVISNGACENCINHSKWELED